MTQERLNGLAMMQYNHNIPIDVDEVVEQFAICQPRNFYFSNFVNILCGYTY